jgi:hypothetical protein
MGKYILVALGSVIIGALAGFVYHSKMAPGGAGQGPTPKVGACANGSEPICIPVSVVVIAGQPYIQVVDKVRLKANGSTPIVWEIDTPGYTFNSDADPQHTGIDFANIGSKPGDNPAGKDEFKNCQRMNGAMGNDTKYRCIFSGATGRFPYQINLNAGTLQLDPYILNN